MAYFNREKRAAMDRAVATYKAAKADLDRHPMNSGPDVAPEDATAEELALIEQALHDTMGRLKSARNAADQAKQLGVDFYSTSLGLLVRKLNSAQWQRVWSPVIADLDAAILMTGATQHFYKVAEDDISQQLAIIQDA